MTKAEQLIEQLTESRHSSHQWSTYSDDKPKKRTTPATSKHHEVANYIDALVGHLTSVVRPESKAGLRLKFKRPGDKKKAWTILDQDGFHLSQNSSMGFRLPDDEFYLDIYSKER